MRPSPHLSSTGRRWLSCVLAAALTASPLSGGVVISEFMASNDSTLATAAGEFEDWLEIHNDSGTAVDLAGWYLTDDPADLRKWQFPSTGATSPLGAGGYLLVFADDSPDPVIGSELHASFKLAAGGEYLALVEPDGETVASQYSPEYPPQDADVSYGIDGGTGSPAYFSTPTPGSANAAVLVEPVAFSVPAGTFTAGFNLALTTATAGATIRFTLDGSLPDASSPVYTAPLGLNATTRVRARAFKPGLATSPVTTAAYLRLGSGPAGFTSNLPVVVLENFGAGNVPDPASPVRQPATLMIFEPVEGVTRLTDAPGIQSRAGLRRRGESTLRPTDSKPNLSVETWGEIDEDSRSITPFGMPAESDWVLYAPWTIDTAMMRNSFIYEVSNEAGRYAVRTRFVEVFLNHEGGNLTDADYQGVYVFMERIKQGPGRVDVADLPDGVTAEPEISGGYIWKKDKLDPDDQTFTVAGKTLASVYPRNMPIAQLTWLDGALEAVDAAIPNGDYESLIDVASFADHHILNVFANNADGLNVSTYYHKDRDGLVNMGPIWDFDRSMGCDIDERASDPEVWSLATDTLFFFHSSAPLWFRDLAFNEPDFWTLWVDRWQAMRNGPLSDAAMIERVERYRSEIGAAAGRNYARWPGVLGAAEWNGKVDVLKNHVLTRGQWIDDQLPDPPAFNGNGGLVAPGFQLTVSGPASVYYSLDGTDPRAPGGSPAGTSYGGPVAINGNTVVKARSWSGTSFVDAPATWPWSPLTEAVFIVEPATVAVTEIMYHPRPPSGAAEAGFASSDFEYLEIRNTGAAPCDLLGLELLDGVRFRFTEGAVTTLPVDGHGLVVGNLEAFKARYSNWASLNILGEFEGNLSNGGEQLSIGYALEGLGTLAEFTYRDDWYPSTDGEGFSLVLRDPLSAPASWSRADAWRHSAGVDGSPGAADPSLLYPPGALVINEVLAHAAADPPGDWIEIHNTTGSAIDISCWLLSNSRGDLAKHVLPGGSVVPAGGYLLLTEADDFGGAFVLSAAGDEVYLSAGAGGAPSEPAYRLARGFGAQEAGVSFGRHLRSDGVADFPAQVSATPGAPNAGPLVGPVIVEELLYHPPSGQHEYVVLRNIAATTVALHDPADPGLAWRTSGIDFVFPPGTALESNEAVVLVRNTITAAAFRAANGIPASIGVFNYAGALDNDKDTLQLERPGVADPVTGFVPYIVVEQVSYTDEAPWPTEADGLGKALRRIDSLAYANDPGNWQAADGLYLPPVQLLTVLSGSGDGGYAAGTVVALQADPPGPGQTFVAWIGNVAGVADVSSPATTLTMAAQDLTVTAMYSINTTFITRGASWNYNDQGTDLGTAWREPGYADAAWPSGPAQLGYGDGDEVTEVDSGNNPQNKPPTIYFRKTFTVEDASAVEELEADLLRDDGAVVYLNGVEVARDNMPGGTVSFATLAQATVGGADEDAYFAHPLDPAALVDGSNVPAVEIHQVAVDSSDLSFDFELSSSQVPDPATRDGDADGMADAFEVLNFGSTEAGLPGADGDGDGFTNVEEFIAGTDPGDPRSTFRITSLAGGTLTWSAVPGRTYSVLWSPDLQTPFVPIASGLAVGSFTDAVHGGDGVGFYRLEVSVE